MKKEDYFYEKIEDLKERYGSCSAIARRMGMDATIVASWKRRDSFPSQESLRIMCNTFKLPFRKMSDSVEMSRLDRKIALLSALRENRKEKNAG